MCGIVGYIGRQKASSIILEGLKRLEYRGYDSAGVAIQNDGRFDVAKKIGRVDGLIKSTPAQKLAGTTGIGHTRWATHGGVTDASVIRCEKLIEHWLQHIGSDTDEPG